MLPFLDMESLVAVAEADQLQIFMQDHRRRNHFLSSDVFGFVKESNVNAAAFSSDPQKSELTTNAAAPSAPRKRPRDDQQINLDGTAVLLNPRLRSSAPMSSLPFNSAVVPDGAFSLPGQQMQTRLLDSANTSTSGRAAVTPPSAPSLLVQDLVANIYQQNLEIDTFIRLQNERLRRGLEEARKRHCQALLSSLEQAIVNRLREKESELDNARRRNSELEEKLRQMSAENQIWFTVAKNNEVIVSGLKASLEQVLQNASANDAAGCCVVDTREGYGDSEVHALTLPAEDTRSCCFEDAAADVAGKANGAMEGRRQIRKAPCKVCGGAEACVLLLPCRHLCLCKACQEKVDTCPVCCAARNASLQIFLDT